MNIPRSIKNTALRPLMLFGASATILALVIISVASILFYNYTSRLLESNLRQRLLAIVTTAAVQFDTNDINSLQQEADWQNPAWSKTLFLLTFLEKQPKIRQSWNL
jgi:hypothetical protein